MVSRWTRLKHLVTPIFDRLFPIEPIYQPQPGDLMTGNARLPSKDYGPKRVYRVGEWDRTLVGNACTDIETGEVVSSNHIANQERYVQP